LQLYLTVIYRKLPVTLREQTLPVSHNTSVREGRQTDRRMNNNHANSSTIT